MGIPITDTYFSYDVNCNKMLECDELELMANDHDSLPGINVFLDAIDNFNADPADVIGPFDRLSENARHSLLNNTTCCEDLFRFADLLNVYSEKRLSAMDIFGGFCIFNNMYD